MRCSMSPETIDKPWSVYIVRCIDNTFYTGISNDIEKRVTAHNKSRGAKYTKTRLPVVLVYSKIIGSKSEACKEEYRIKQLTKAEKENLIGSSSTEN